MDVSAASSSAVSATASATPTNPAAARLNLQVSLLKKALESQQEQAAELMRMTEGKGQTLDIRA